MEIFSLAYIRVVEVRATKRFETALSRYSRLSEIVKIKIPRILLQSTFKVQFNRFTSAVGERCTTVGHFEHSATERPDIRRDDEQRHRYHFVAFVTEFMKKKTKSETKSVVTFWCHKVWRSYIENRNEIINLRFHSSLSSRETFDIICSSVVSISILSTSYKKTNEIQIH